MTRTINSPGFEVHEIDKSLYNKKINTSLKNAPVCLMLGYANKGEDYIPLWINIKKTFDETYGYPTNELERYLYNTALEVLDNGGICITSKLPYDNDQKQHYAYVDYNAYEMIYEFDDDLSALTTTDSSISNVLKISNMEYDDETQTKFNLSGLIDNLELNDLLSKSIMPEIGTIKIVDISHLKYTKSLCNIVQDTETYQWTNDCLGIIPVIVSPVNALYFLNILLDKDNHLHTSCFNNIDSFVPCFINESLSDLNIDTTNLSKNENLFIPFVSDNKTVNTLSKLTIDLFPTLQWKNANELDRKYFKHIGLVVLKAYNDKANNNKLNFQILESFVGTLDYNEALNNPNVLFIDDVVNFNSLYVRMFSNVSLFLLNWADIVYVNNQRSTSLGFYEKQCVKTFPDVETIKLDIKKSLSKLDDTMTLQIDIVLDAGMTNIVQWKALDELYRLTCENDSLEWRNTANIFDDFCKNKRKDCMFICDGLRPLSLNNEQKIVNPLINNTVENSIIPKFKYINKLDSSYSAGYCVWFQIKDAYSGKYFWMPPSGKVIKSYINCNTYFHPWDAPAGIIRGKLTNVIDISFNPNLKEADYIYSNGWNYALSYPLDGNVIEGLKTFQGEETALDRINVRRLMLWLERSVISIAKYFVYEHNTQYNRLRFIDTITPVFEQAKSGFGLLEYGIKCDDDINTPETIDHNELHVKIAVKPVKTIEFICISFVLTNLTANVQEELLK